jgi:hypothetical protein
VEVQTGDGVIAPKMSLGLVPEVLDSVEVIALVGEQFEMFDPHVAELQDIEHVIASKTVGIDNAIRLNLLANSRNKKVKADSGAIVT